MGFNSGFKGLTYFTAPYFSLNFRAVLVMLDYGIKKLFFISSNHLTYKLLLYRVTLKSNTRQNFYWSHVSSSDYELLRFKQNPAVGDNAEVVTEVFLGIEERHLYTANK